MLDAADAAPSEPLLPADAGARAEHPTSPTSAANSTSAVAPAEPSTAEPASWTTWWLSDRDVLVFTVLSSVLLLLVGYRWAVLSGWGAHEIEIERQTPLAYNFRLDPNTASWVELAQLEGVGETLALRIVEDRETNGPFRSLEDLDRVKGIGAKTVERLRPYLHVASVNDAQE
jgi:competence protein ComEA